MNTLKIIHKREFTDKHYKRMSCCNTKVLNKPKQSGENEKLNITQSDLKIDYKAIIFKIT
jgi:hypothetical protein